VLQGANETGWEAALAGERTSLVRLCAQLTGDAEAAEDLAHETLVKALRHSHELRDGDKRAQWLYAIARNECLQWARSRGRELARRVPASPGGDSSASTHEDALADDFDVEVELERAELAHLLDRALALLPPTMRTVLIERYIQESSLAEVAARLGLSEGAVAKRLERGKLILRRVLTTELSNEAAAYGLVAGDTDGWQETRMWCMVCGQQRILGRWAQNHTELLLRCPACCSGPDMYLTRALERCAPGLFQGIKGFKAAASRIVKWCNNYARPGQCIVPCVGCGRLTPVRQDHGDALPPAFRDPSHTLFYQLCAACDTLNMGDVAARILALPEGRRFCREHARIRRLPEREVEAMGGPAIVTTFESVTGEARLEVVTARDVFEIISIHGAPPDGSVSVP
jgi:RNA polymerase sigma factor (sigma-70 family)